jgi:hypothetical protein
LEAYLAIQNGSVTPEFQEATILFQRKYLEMKEPIAGLNFGEIYMDF